MTQVSFRDVSFILQIKGAAKIQPGKVGKTEASKLGHI
jgi:hypothetical protein